MLKNYWLPNEINNRRKTLSPNCDGTEKRERGRDCLFVFSPLTIFSLFVCFFTTYNFRGSKSLMKLKPSLQQEKTRNFFLSIQGVR
jgi:hypothetical protein